MISELYNKNNYTMELDFLISRFIREYDISKANINILYSAGIINDDIYQQLYNSDRMYRQIQVGYLLKDNPTASKILHDGIIEAKKSFFIANNITDNEVLSIKNDAIYLIDKVAEHTQFGLVHFVPKNMYTSFYHIHNTDKELYYYIDTVNNIEKLHVKGIKSDKLALHENYFLEFLKVLFCSAETERLEDTINLLTSFYDNYLKLQLSIGYYRRFDSESIYILKKISDIASFKAEYLPESSKEHVDISYNLNILRQLHQYYSTMLSLRR